jgi:hypothetical protein
MTKTFNIERILYDTTRELMSVEEKMSIASLFLFCYSLVSQKFCELLYSNDHTQFIDNLSKEYEPYEVDLSVRLSDKNIRSAFNKTVERVRLDQDKNGFLKALFEKDPFALAIDGICNYGFKKPQ